MKRPPFTIWRAGWRTGLQAGILAASALAILLAAGCAASRKQASAAPPPVAAASQPTTLLLNITSGKNDPHAVTMALDLAAQALERGHEVVLFFNVAGVEIPTHALSESVGIGDISVKQRLRDLVQGGARVMVCPRCMQYLGVPDTDLLPGAVVASAELFFSTLGPDTVIMTY